VTTEQDYLWFRDELLVAVADEQEPPGLVEVDLFEIARAGHRGANHPVKRLADGRVEITSMNHGFAVEAESLPANARPTHISLFDGSLCGLELTDRPAFSVQYHPEASPGPQDSQYLFGKFVGMLA